jgi:hypothetical protein
MNARAVVQIAFAQGQVWRLRRDTEKRISEIRAGKIPEAWRGTPEEAIGKLEAIVEQCAAFGAWELGA